MAQLPTVEVTPQQVSAAFEAFDGDVEKYRRWLLQVLRDYVLEHKREQLLKEARNEVWAQVRQLDDQLWDAPEEAA